MFHILAHYLDPDQTSPNAIFELHPLRHLSFLEWWWSIGGPEEKSGMQIAGLNPDVARSMYFGLEWDDERSTMSGRLSARLARSSHLGVSGPYWHHLIYAYMVECTRANEIFSAVLFDIVHGERLGNVSPITLQWARVTEQLFFAANPWAIGSVNSSLRPDPRATRRNAYHRLLGLEVERSDKQGATSVSFERSPVSNGAFCATLEAFLREVWRGYVNATNTSGARATDHSAIAEHATQLSSMLRDRRQGGMLAREEFAAVAAMSWLHVTIATQNDVMKDLKATAATPEERLAALGARVNIAPPKTSRALLQLSWRLSVLLREIEAGKYQDASSVRVLYDPTLPYDSSSNPIAKDMVEIINHWSTATGHDLKAVPTMAAPAPAAVA